VSSQALERFLQRLESQAHNDPHDEKVRLAVRLRAREACEYCLMPSTGQFHIDHIIPVSGWDEYTAGDLKELGREPSRRGPHHLANFAWACPFCNGAKREQVGYRIRGKVHSLFDPRHDRWEDHFGFLHSYLFIVGLTDIGEATEKALRFNAGDIHGPLGPRHVTIWSGNYPPPWVSRL
jgi:hypothetical protein